MLDERRLNTISVNFSYREMIHPDFVSTLLNTINRHGVYPEWITIEITESYRFHNLKQLATIIKCLNVFGIRFSLDDFCTGYSCLSHMRLLPIDAIKLDRSFVTGVTRDSKSYIINKGLIETARQLGVCVVAEGIETNDQATLFAELGCHYLQGYYYAKPMALHQVQGRLGYNKEPENRYFPACAPGALGAG